MNENRISENDMFKNETIEKLIDSKDIIKSHLASLDAKHMIKSLLAFLVVYKEVFTETNQPIKNYIEMVRQKREIYSIWWKYCQRRKCQRRRCQRRKCK